MRGILAAAALARSEGYKRIFVPAIDAPEAALIPDIEVYPVETLNQLWRHFIGEELIPPFQPSEATAPPSPTSTRQTSARSKDRSTSNARSKSLPPVVTMFL